MCIRIHQELLDNGKTKRPRDPHLQIILTQATNKKQQQQSNSRSILIHTQTIFG